jgi:uncharacterized protein YdcH (DUF465 family)
LQAGSFEESKQQMMERLSAEHRALKARVHELEGHISLTSQEQLELARLKKLKLHTKDQLYTLRQR